MIRDYRQYVYKGLTPNREGDVIGYALIQPSFIKENGEKIENTSIAIMLNKQGLKDYATILRIRHVISKVHYSSKGNYLGEEETFIPSCKW